MKNRKVVWIALVLVIIGPCAYAAMTAMPSSAKVESICTVTPVSAPPVGGLQKLRNISFDMVGWWDFTHPISGEPTDAEIWCGDLEPPTGECALLHGGDIPAEGWTRQGFDMTGYENAVLYIGFYEAIFPAAGADPYDDVAQVSLWRADMVSQCLIHTVYNGDAADRPELWNKFWYKLELIPDKQWPVDMVFGFSSYMGHGSDFAWEDAVVIVANEQHTVFIPLVLMGAQ